MIDKRYYYDVIQGIPTSLLVGFLVLFGVGTILFLVFLGGKRGARWSAGLLLFEYMSFLFTMDVLLRKVQAVRKFDFAPFWSYRAIREGHAVLLTQDIANVCVFIPIGLLLGCAFERMKWWQVLLIGGGFSVLIELSQFVFKRGFAEFDDVFHNVVGCAIGYGVYVLAVWLIEKYRGRAISTEIR